MKYAWSVSRVSTTSVTFNSELRKWWSCSINCKTLFMTIRGLLPQTYILQCMHRKWCTSDQLAPCPKYSFKITYFYSYLIILLWESRCSPLSTSQTCTSHHVLYSDPTCWAGSIKYIPYMHNQMSGDVTCTSLCSGQHRYYTTDSQSRNVYKWIYFIFERVLYRLLVSQYTSCLLLEHRWFGRCSKEYFIGF